MGQLTADPDIVRRERNLLTRRRDAIAPRLMRELVRRTSEFGGVGVRFGEYLRKTKGRERRTLRDGASKKEEGGGSPLGLRRPPCGASL